MVKSDRENAEFLYSIVKQLDTRFIDWELVAVANSMTKDHAARMRFHRLRKDMEGADFQSRKRKLVSESMAAPKKKKKTGKSVLDNPTDDEEPLLQKWKITDFEAKQEEENKPTGVKLEQKLFSGDVLVKQEKNEEYIKLEDDSDFGVKVKIPFTTDIAIGGVKIEKFDDGAM